MIGKLHSANSKVSHHCCCEVSPRLTKANWISCYSAPCAHQGHAVPHSAHQGHAPAWQWWPYRNQGPNFLAHAKTNPKNWIPRDSFNEVAAQRHSEYYKKSQKVACNYASTNTI